MTLSFQLSIINYQLSLNDQFSMIKQAAKQKAANICKLLNDNLLEIENCKLKITPTKGSVI
jgi:hypothetical protein